ncbi:hypothetical protein [Oceanobacillus profundus]|nr:hypothetical protein [Oceanobacillus profundus]
MKKKGGKKMTISTPSRRSVNHSTLRSARKVREDAEARKLSAISKTIDVTKLKNQDPLQVDKFGRVNISPDHPNYKFWMEDE